MRVRCGVEVDFCRRYGGLCDGPRLSARDIRLDAQTWNVITEVNRSVNAAIDPVTDLEHWSVADRWDLPSDGRGDCEDYVLLKRKLLAERGFSRGSRCWSPSSSTATATAMPSSP